MVRSNEIPDQTDIFVIGGGPAGLAAALAARRQGFEVTVADSLVPPIDKPCGEGLMSDSVAILEQIGFTLPREAAQPFRGIRFVSGDTSIAASFPQGSGYGMRRTRLHEVMTKDAAAAGIRLFWGTVITGIDNGTVHLQGNRVRARWIIGADGSSSRVRAWAGLDDHLRLHQRYAFRRHYRIAPWSEFMEIHWAHGCQIYVTPVASDEVCVALISREPQLRLDAALLAFPELAAHLAGAEHSSSERGAVSVTRKLRRLYRDRVVLLGDASGGVDAITGEGMCLAFHQAALLADCLRSGDLARYQAGHRALARRPAFMASLMLTLEHDSLRRRIMQVFQAQPRVFARMLAMHVGSETPLGFAANGLALGWGLLTA
jgi:flavin-dependent dehydrogenase